MGVKELEKTVEFIEEAEERVLETMSSSRDEKRDLRKQIGCMNGIFQIFDRHHFITGRRISSCSSKRPLQGKFFTSFQENSRIRIHGC